MFKIFKIFFLFTFLFYTSIFAQSPLENSKNSLNNNLDLLSISTADSLWNLNYEKLDENISQYIQKSDAKAIRVYDTLLKKNVLVIVKNNDNKIKIFEDKILPKEFRTNNYISEKKDIYYKNEKIGEIVAYFLNSNKITLKLNSKELQWLEDNKKIKVHVETNWEPFNFVENGVIKGYSNDFIKLLANKIGIELEFVKGFTWSEYIEKLKNKEIDLISNMVKTPNRENFTIFSEESIHNIAPAIYSNKRNFTFNNLKDLENYKVAVVKGFWQEELIRKNYPQIQIVSVSNTLEGIKYVASNKADALIDLGPVVQNLINKYAIENVYFKGITDFENSNQFYDRIGIRKDWGEFKSIIDKAIKSLSYQEKQKLYQVWFVNNPLKDSHSIKKTNNQKTLNEKLLINSKFKTNIYNKNKKILLLHSYHTGYNWTDSITQGVKALFPYSTNVSLSIEYMDTKRNFDKTYVNLLKSKYQYRYKDEKFDVIIASDNNALDFLVDYGHLIFTNTPIVFTGANYFQKEQLKGKRNITGVSEEADIEATLKLAVKLHPNTKQIFIVNDQTNTAKLVDSKIKEIAKQFNKRIEFIYSKPYSMEELIDTIKNLPKNSIIFYHHFFKDKNGVYYDTDDSIKRISNATNLPIYGAWDFTLGKGVIGGKLINGYIQGLEAANIAHKILSGQKADNIPVVKESSTRFIFDKYLLDIFNINKKLLPKDSILIQNTNNIQFSFEKREVSLSNKEKAFLEKNPVIKISNEMSWPPFDFAVGNQPQGYFIDLLKLISQRVGFEIEFINGYTWSELIEKFEKKEIDLVHPVGIIKSRKEKWIFSKPAFSYRPSYATKNHIEEIKDISELYGKKVAVGKGFGYEEFLKLNYPYVKLHPVTSVKEGLDLVSKGEVFAMIDSQPVLKYVAKKNFYSNISIHGWFWEYNEGDPSKLHFMTHRDKPELITMINKALLTITPGELESLEKKWFGSNGSKNANNQLDLSKEEIQYLREKKIIKMCVLPNALPYEGIDDKGKHVGIAEDMIKIIEKRVGIPIVLHKTKTWAASHEAIKSGFCDILPVAQDLPKRRAYLDFTKPYITQTTVIATRSEELFVSSLEEIKDKKIAIVKKYAHAYLIQKAYPNLEIVGVSSIKEGLEKVRNKEVYGYIDALGSIGYELQKEGNFEIKIAGKIGFNLKLSIATRKDEPLLNDIFTKAIDAFTQEEVKKIYDKWIAVKFEDRVDYTLIYQIVAISLVILISVIFWNRRLKAEIEKRNIIEKQLREAKQQALDASQAKSDFLANMSHEIRTPMNGIIGMTTLAINKMDKEPQLAKDFLKKGQSSAKMLLRIINDILDFSKIEAGKLDIHITDMSLRETISSLNDLFSHMAHEKNLEFIIEQDEFIPEYIKADPLRLSQVLTNLISNAIKFTQEGSIKIKVEFLSKENDDITLKFWVIDTGKGIAQDRQDKLFSSFTQEDNSISREYGGTGLGLVISKKLIELMNGEIGFESIENEGSKFFFTIKTKLANNKIIKKESKAKKEKIKELEAAFEEDKILDARILLVEDNEINQELAFTFLKEMVSQIDIANNGKEAIDKIYKKEADYYNLVLMDIHMPILDGYSATKKIKSDAKYKNIPIIAMTANALKSDVEKCLNHGMVDHIPKPFDVIQLKEKIYKVITQKDDINLIDKSLETITKPNDLVLNYNAAIKRMIGRDDLYKDFLNGFIKQRTHSVETIEELINKDKLEEATTEIHSLKGFVNTMGAENFGGKLENYEVILKENKTLNKDELDDIKLDFEKVVSEVKIWLKRN